MDQRFTLSLILEPPFQDMRYMRAIKLEPDIVSISPRVVDEMRMGLDLGLRMVSADAAVRVIKQRMFRRELFLQVARQLGGQMADYMEDSEGWHGPDRAEKVREIIKRDSR